MGGMREYSNDVKMVDVPARRVRIQPSGKHRRKAKWMAESGKSWTDGRAGVERLCPMSEPRTQNPLRGDIGIHLEGL